MVCMCVGELVGWLVKDNLQELFLFSYPSPRN